MKRKYWYLIVILVVVVGLLLPLVLRAQPPDERVPPLPPYPGSDVERPPLPPEQRPTPTPNHIEAQSLPKVTPPVIPTVEMIDTAPDVSRWDKYEIVIQRGKSGKKVYILVPVGVELEDVLNEHLNPAEGDKVLVVAPAVGKGKLDFIESMEKGQ
jgi:hypothetical protein